MIKTLLACVACLCLSTSVHATGWNIFAQGRVYYSDEQPAVVANNIEFTTDGKKTIVSPPYIIQQRAEEVKKTERNAVDVIGAGLAGVFIGLICILLLYLLTECLGRR